MHYTVRLIIASAISGVIGWISIIVGNWMYMLVTSHQPATSSDFTILNWTISLILSGIIFVIAYLKATEWLGE